MRSNGDREAFPANMEAGLTKRELLAGLALAGLLARRADQQPNGDTLVREALGVADALLRALGQARERPSRAAVAEA